MIIFNATIALTTNMAMVRVSIHNRVDNDDPWGSSFCDRVIWSEKDLIAISDQAEKWYPQYRISHVRWAQDPLEKGRWWAQLLISGFK